MPSELFVSYLRPVLSGQDTDDRDLAMQRAAIGRHLGRHGRLAGEVVEVEPDSPDADRPGLGEALTLCRRHGAALLMAELGASSEDPVFLRNLGCALRPLGLRFAVAGRPEVSELTLGLMAAVAEIENRLGVTRTAETAARRREFYVRFTAERRATDSAERAGIPAHDGAEPRALAESRNRGGTTRGSRKRAEDVAPILSEIRAAGALTLEQVANALNALCIPSARGNRWYPMQVTRIEKRLASAG